MTRADSYRQRAASYAAQALRAEPRYRHMYAELAKGWRDLADAEDGAGRSPEPRTLDPD